MPYTMEDFRRDVIRESLAKMSPQEKREYLGLSPNEILQLVSAHEINAYLADVNKPSAGAKPKKPKRRPR